MNSLSRPNTKQALALVEGERERQEILKIEGRFTYTLADPMHEAEKAACLMEEMGEVCRNVLARMEKVTDGDTSDAELIKELSQVAALAVAWIESLI